MSNRIESEGQYKKNELLKKAKKQGIKFSIDYGETDGDYEIVTCSIRNLVEDKKARLLFIQEETTKIAWILLMTFMGVIIPAFMFLEENIKLKIFATIIFLGFQVGAIALTNATRPEIRIFDKPSGKYKIKRSNHILTRIFRKTWLDIADLNKVTHVKLITFTAKRWIRKTMGTGEEKYYRHDLCMFENYRLLLETIEGERICIYDMHDQDHVLETGEKIAEYLGVELRLDMK